MGNKKAHASKRDKPKKQTKFAYTDILLFFSIMIFAFSLVLLFTQRPQDTSSDVILSQQAEEPQQEEQGAENAVSPYVIETTMYGDCIQDNNNFRSSVVEYKKSENSLRFELGTVFSEKEDIYEEMHSLCLCIANNTMMEKHEPSFIISAENSKGVEVASVSLGWDTAREILDSDDSFEMWKAKLE